MNVTDRKEATDLELVLISQFQNLFSAEHHLAGMLPSLTRLATASELKFALNRQGIETKAHLAALTQMLEQMGEQPEEERRNVMSCLLQEGGEIARADVRNRIRDTRLVALARRVEHYKIAEYGTARTLCKWLGRSDLAAQLKETLKEEAAADQRLSAVAETVCNPHMQGF